MSGTSIGTSGGGGKIGDKPFVKGSRGILLYLVRSDVAQALADKNGDLMPMIADSFGRIPVKDAQLVDLLEALGGIDITNTLLQTLINGVSIPKPVKVQTKVVSCPVEPVKIPGIGAGAIYADGDAMGTTLVVNVPPSGIIYSATLWDFDDEGKQIDLEIFKDNPPEIADNAAWSPTDVSMEKFITELNFFAFDDHVNNQTSEIENIGKAYTAPKGKFYIRAVSRGAPTIALGSEPRIQIQILSDNPDWEG